MERLSAKMAQLEQLKASLRCWAGCLTTEQHARCKNPAATINNTVVRERSRPNEVLMPVQVERMAQGKQLMEKLGALWAAATPGEAAEGRAAVEAAMAGSTPAHCATIAKARAASSAADDSWDRSAETSPAHTQLVARKQSCNAVCRAPLHPCRIAFPFSSHSMP